MNHTIVITETAAATDWRDSVVAARMAWMASHVCWVGALSVSVQTGLKYSDLCDSAYSNGNNGPFGYGQHEHRVDLIMGMLLLGLIGAIVLSIVFRWGAARRLRGGNLAIGAVGGFVALRDYIAQSERNPYCTVGGVWPTAAIASALLACAVLVNTGVFGACADWWRDRCPASPSTLSD